MSISKRQRASRTAELVAAVRAGHTLHQGGALFADPLAVRLLGFPWRQIACSPWLYRWVSERVMARVRPVHTQILLRANICQQVVSQAFGDGATQYLIMGAGLDSFAYEQAAAWPDVCVYEADHPASQTLKKNRLKRAHIEIPAQLRWVPIDFERDALVQSLSAAGWQRNQKSVVAWMGTTYYLSQDAIAKSLRQLHTMMPSGSRIVLDHGLNDAFIDVDARRQYANMRQFVAQRGEPMVTRFAPDEFESLAQRCGYRMTQVWSPKAQRRLMPATLDLPFGGYSQVAVIEVV